MRQFTDARHRAKLTQKEAAELCGVTLKTVQRWESGYREPPPSAVRLLEYRADLGAIHKAWCGWQIFDDCLHTDTGVFFKVGEIRYLELLWKRLERLQAEVISLRKRQPIRPCERREHHQKKGSEQQPLAKVVK